MAVSVAAIPPFERFYDEHRNAVFGFLVRRVGPDAAEDAFQETFLRALRGYASLEHGKHLRAWIFTIATRVCIDQTRRTPSNSLLQGELEVAVEDAQPVHLQLDHLADELPPTEHAAVLLRYGYDLDYAEIGAALGSSEDAARQAASSGIRRLRRKEGGA